MNYLKAFEISAAGLNVERTRLDASAMNIANVHTTRTVNGAQYIPLTVTTSAKMKGFQTQGLQMGDRVAVPFASVTQQFNSLPKLVFEPSHPDANKEGFVAYPGVDTVMEMVNIMSAVRAYEANTVAISAAKAMAMKAIELGSGA